MAPARALVMSDSFRRTLRKGVAAESLREGSAVGSRSILREVRYDFARRALKAATAPATPTLHFTPGWVSSQVR